MITVTIDLLEGPGGSHRLQQGWEGARTAMVEGLNPNNDMTEPALEYAAEQAVITITGDRGSPCPGLPFATYLSEFSHEKTGANAVKTTIHYRGYPLAVFTLGGSLNQIQTNIDNTGAAITTQYKYPADYFKNGKDASDKRKTPPDYDVQGGLVNADQPEPAFTVKWTIVGNPVWSAFYQATAWSLAYTGKVNSGGYSVGAISGAERTWKCTACHGTSGDGGLSMQMEMTLQYRESTWDMSVTYINPDNGLPPPDLEKGKGSVLAQVADSTDFPVFNFGIN